MSSVTFVIPVFNKSSYLKTVIKSLKKQNGDFDREFIFIDDGSTDNSLKIIKKETKNLKKCKIISQKNKGSANATNVGIKAAKMKYIKFLDADDVILSDSTESLIEIFENNPSCNLAYGLQRKVQNIDNVNLDEKINKENLTYIKNPAKLAMRNSMFNPSQFMVKTDLCQMTNGCDERVKFSQEYSLTLKLSMFGGFIRLNHALAILPFKAPGQISEKKNQQIFRVSKALELFLKENKDLSLGLKLYAQRRLTARSWRFAKRFLHSIFFSRWFFLYCIGLFRLPFNIIKTCEEANKVYKSKLD